MISSLTDWTINCDAAKTAGAAAGRLQAKHAPHTVVGFFMVTTATDDRHHQGEIADIPHRVPRGLVSDMANLIHTVAFLLPFLDGGP